MYMKAKYKDIKKRKFIPFLLTKPNNYRICEEVFWLKFCLNRNNSESV